MGKVTHLDTSVNHKQKETMMEKNNHDEFTNPSVQDVINRLMRVDDKSQRLEIQMWGEDGCNIDYSGIEILELVSTHGTPYCVAIDIKFTGEVIQKFDQFEADEQTIEYCGEQIALSKYEAKHRPDAQPMINGVPFNPRLREGFDSTPNDYRDGQEKTDWWDRPFIQSYTWADMCDAYVDYLERMSDSPNYTPKSREKFDHEQAERRAAWFEAWPTGIRYDVRCLDGGAWDRSTCLAQVDNLDDAIGIAQHSLEKW